MPAGDHSNFYLLGMRTDHVVMAGLALWFTTSYRPRMDAATRQVVVAGLVALFISRLQWRRTVRAMENMVEF